MPQNSRAKFPTILRRLKTRKPSSATTLLSLSMLFTASVIFSACDTTDATDDQPGVISPEAFDVTKALFPSNSATQSFTNKGESQAKTNWTNAALRVGVVSTGIGLHLVLPTAATSSALSAAPSIDQGVWIWSSSVQVASQQVTFDLEGTPSGQDVEWAMFVTTSVPFLGETYDRFELYNATTAFDGQSGDYSLFYRIDGQRTRVLDADFNITDSGSKLLEFTIPPGLDHSDDTAAYTFDGTNRIFDWNDVSESNNSLVEWDDVDESGSIIADDYNGGLKACWDTDLEDVDC